MKYRKKPVVIEAIQWNGDISILDTFPKEETENVKLRNEFSFGFLCQSNLYS